MNKNPQKKLKAIITDIDGTAVPNAHDAAPSKRVLEAIRHAQQKNIPVCVSTGRPIFLARDIIKKLGIIDPCAINDATQIYDPKTSSVLETFPLSDTVAAKAKDILLANNLQFMVNSGETEVHYDGGVLPSGICGLTIPEQTIERAEEIIKLFDELPNASVRKSPSYIKDRVWVVITSPIATKLHGVHELTKLIGVDPSEVMGIGDGYNDFALLSACGFKVAMGNAVEDLKGIADYVAPTVEHDGFAVVVEKFFLS